VASLTDDASSSDIFSELYYFDRCTIVELFRDGEKITSIGQVYQMLVMSIRSCLHVLGTTSPTLIKAWYMPLEWKLYDAQGSKLRTRRISGGRAWILINCTLTCMRLSMNHSLPSWHMDFVEGPNEESSGAPTDSPVEGPASSLYAACKTNRNHYRTGSNERPSISRTAMGAR